MSTPIPKPMPATTTTSSSSSDPVTASVPTSTAHPHKPPFIRPAPPLFLGKPINPSGGAVTAAPFYHSAGSARGFPPRALADRMVTVASPAGYIRSSGGPTSVMSLQAHMQQHHQHQHHQQQHHQQQHHSLPPVGAHHPMRAPHHLVVPRQQVGSCGPPHSAAAAVAMQPKVAPFPAVSPVPENISNDKDKGREDTVVVIHDRKVRLSEGSSGSLYALCRSWVRNGLPQESQPTIGDGSKLLPKPLPASVVNSRALEVSEDANEVEHSDKDEDLASGEQLSAQDLLRGHIKRAKKVRARLRQERLLRIERYKQRLSLLLPTQTELIGRNEATPGS